MSSVAIVLPQATATHGEPGVQIFWNGPCPNIGQTKICPIWIDLNDSGDCNPPPDDRVGKMSKKAIDAAGFDKCPT